MKKIYNSTKGDNIKYVIRKSLENEKQWVIEVYFDNREYPNIISGRYKTLKACRDAIGEYQHNKNFNFWGNV